MELVFVLAIWLRQMFLVNLLEVVQIIWTFRVGAFMYNEVLAVFLMNKSMRAMRTSKNDLV